MCSGRLQQAAGHLGQSHLATANWDAHNEQASPPQRTESHSLEGRRGGRRQSGEVANAHGPTKGRVKNPSHRKFLSRGHIVRRPLKEAFLASKIVILD